MYGKLVKKKVKEMKKMNKVALNICLIDSPSDPVRELFRILRKAVRSEVTLVAVMINPDKIVIVARIMTSTSTKLAFSLRMRMPHDRGT